MTLISDLFEMTLWTGIDEHATDHSRGASPARTKA
jgi:hypothetical protein